MHVVRLETHHAHDYPKLHAELAKIGVRRQIKDNKGRLYDLPTGTYAAPGGFTAGQIYDAVFAVAQRLGHGDAEILVTDDTNLVFNLKLATKVAA